MSETDSCCRCCCSFVLTLGLSALFLWLSLRTTNPKCSIETFYLPALNKSLSNTQRINNNTLYFVLKLENTNKDKGVNYDDVNVTVFDSPSRNTKIGSSTIPRFYQGHKKKAHKNSSFGFDRRVVVAAVDGNGSATFAVDVVTAVRFKIMAWRTNRHRISVKGEVKVNDMGEKEYKKAIGLKSSSTRTTIGFFEFFVFGFFVVFVF